MLSCIDVQSNFKFVTKMVGWPVPVTATDVISFHMLLPPVLSLVEYMNSLCCRVSLFFFVRLLESRCHEHRLSGSWKRV